MKDNLVLFGLTPARVRADIPLSGSPERSAARCAVEDTDGHVWVLERLKPGQQERRERIGRALAALKKAGLPVAAYHASTDGRYTAEGPAGIWQAAPYVPGDPLPRPDYVDHASRGVALGTFLADLQEAAPSIHEFDTAPRFILEDYANDLLETVRPRRPDVHAAMAHALPVLAPLFEAWGELPESLCQGDFHPLNIIWRGSDVAAVIDWEFAGMRPALFDAANCLGCIAIEDPQALVNGLAPTLLRTLRQRGCLDPTGFALLPELVIGMRFAWMSEWLRRGDTEMIDLESRLIPLLANSIDTLHPAWRQIVDKP
ncbi:phosphotransferase enzyme family protein [Pseudodesulfovibrio sp.]|uniref:phosphotransferase enzyme family protein n=1 Tax=unclassified Pseudodesulfovibrio TaxID=2661612 RepID=UPI003AFFA430